MEPKLFKMSSGDMVMAEILDEVNDGKITTYNCKNAVVVSLVPVGPEGQAALMMMSLNPFAQVKDLVIPIKDKDIAFFSDAPKELVAKYIEKTSGIVVPTAKAPPDLKIV